MGLAGICTGVSPPWRPVMTPFGWKMAEAPDRSIGRRRNGIPPTYGSLHAYGISSSGLAAFRSSWWRRRRQMLAWLQLAAACHASGGQRLIERLDPICRGGCSAGGPGPRNAFKPHCRYGRHSAQLLLLISGSSFPGQACASFILDKFNRGLVVGFLGKPLPRSPHGGGRTGRT